MAIRFYRPEQALLDASMENNKEPFVYSRTIWSKCRSFFKKNQCTSTVVMSGERDYAEFAWDDDRLSIRKLVADLHYFLKIPQDSFVTLLKLQNISLVRIIGFDEIAWLFSELLKKASFPFYVEDDRWVFLPQDYATTRNEFESIPDTNVLTLLFEANPNVTPVAYDKIKFLCDELYEDLYVQQVELLKRVHGNHVKLVYFPNRQEVEGTSTLKELLTIYRGIDVTKAGLKPWEEDILKECISELEWEYYTTDVYLNGIHSIRDKISDIHMEDILNITDGVRHTKGQNDMNEKKLYIIGTCEILSRRTDDASTIVSFIQGYLNQDNMNCNAYNYGAGAQSVLSRFSEFLTEEPSEKLKFICYIGKNFRMPRTIVDYDVSQLHQQRNDDTTWYVSDPSHLMAKGNECVAQGIYENIVKDLMR